MIRINIINISVILKKKKKKNPVFLMFEESLSLSSVRLVYSSVVCAFNGLYLLPSVQMAYTSTYSLYFMGLDFIFCYVVTFLYSVKTCSY